MPCAWPKLHVAVNQITVRVAELHGKSCVGGDGKFRSVLLDTRGFKAHLTGLTQASSWREGNKTECLTLVVVVVGKMLQQQQPEEASPDGAGCNTVHRCSL